MVKNWQLWITNQVKSAIEIDSLLAVTNRENFGQELGALKTARNLKAQAFSIITNRMNR